MKTITAICIVPLYIGGSLVNAQTSAQETWVTHYADLDSNSTASALALDDSGNVYVTGMIGDPLRSDYCTVKYNAAGAEQWVARYNGPGDAGDGAYAIVVTGKGNIYVTGWSMGSGTGLDYATVKYNSAGMEEWVARYNGPGNSGDTPSAITMDGLGNIYVTGTCTGAGTGKDFATIKYNSAGVEQWVARHTGAGENYDGANAVVVDDSGNVYVTGVAKFPESGNDYVTIKYDASGVEQWVARHNGLANGDDSAVALAVDKAGNVYVTGGSEASHRGNLDYTTVKYNAAGEERWIAHYDGTINSTDAATAVVADDSQNVFVTGSSYGLQSARDYVTIKYDSAGIEQWQARYDGPAHSVDEAIDLVLDATGMIYVTGTSGGSNTWNDFATTAYSSAGVQQWLVRFDGPDHQFVFDDARDFAVDNAGDVYVTGTSKNALRNKSFYTTIKYTQTIVSVKENTLGASLQYNLSRNYPNPFNPSTTIRFALPKAEYVTLRVCNLLGQEVATLVNETRPAGEFEVLWSPVNLPSGVYFYFLKAGEFVETKKLLLLK